LGGKEEEKQQTGTALAGMRRRRRRRRVLHLETEPRDAEKCREGSAATVEKLVSTKESMSSGEWENEMKMK
jgi:predicted aminopeptidase